MPQNPRPLGSRDVPELVQLCREHAQYERAPWREFDRVAQLEALFLDAHDAHCWVIDGDGELAGFASATLERSTWDAGRFLHLDCIYLRPAYRGRALGQALMRVVARAATDLGALNLQWQTPAWNVDAVRFYRRLGAGSAEKLRFSMTPEQCALLQGATDHALPGAMEDSP